MSSEWQSSDTEPQWPESLGETRTEQHGPHTLTWIDRGLETTIGAFPNSQQGFGRLYLPDVLSQTPSRVYVDKVVASPGSSWEDRYAVDDPSLPVRVALAWTDPAGPVGASNPLVHDLNLSIRVGQGANCAGRYVGNRLDGNEQSIWYSPCSEGEGSVEDATNNVEIARFFPTTARGDTTFTVRVSSLTAEQPFALVVWNAKGPPPAMPASFIATATSGSAVQLTWSTVAGLTYELQRSTGPVGSYANISCTTSGCTDSAAANTTYVYRLRARNSVGASEWVVDAATTTVFTDPTLSAGSTVVRAAHIVELRQATGALRTIAGLSPFAWTDPSLGAGTTVRAVHTTELRTALSEARNMVGLPSQTFTDPALSSGVLIRAVHLNELRQGVQ